jgi:uncharacterized protein YceK
MKAARLFIFVAVDAMLGGCTSIPSKGAARNRRGVSQLFVYQLGYDPFTGWFASCLGIP